MKLFITLLIIVRFLLPGYNAFAQQPQLSKKISLSVSQKKLADVLQLISSKGGFYFSYDSRIIKKDSLVTIHAQNTTVREILDKIFAGYLEYKVSDNYIILHKRQPAPLTPAAVIKTYIIKGMVHDTRTGAGVEGVSIYEKTKLAVTLTESDGSFALKLKTKSVRPVLYASKENYYDTALAVSLPPPASVLVLIQNAELPVIDSGSITIISPTDTVPIIVPDSTIALTSQPATPGDTTRMVERTGFGKFILSSKQKIQSLNLSSFYTTRAYQVSLVPGLSTHGRLGPQVENYVSINVLGGYTGGTKAFEVGGLFNINRRDAAYFQTAGLLNIVGGSFSGLQAAGLHNHVLVNVNGLQAAGISNYNNQSINGMQAAGIYNHVRDTVRGFQAAGISNFAGKNGTGIQVAGIANITAEIMYGVQIAGIFNYAEDLRGLQIGLVNIADTSNGFSIGLINIVRRGYHQVSISANEITNTNIDIKTGNRKLYSILHAGYNFSDNDKVFAYGYGLGTTIKISRGFTFHPELLARYLYTGDWNNSNILSSLRLYFQAKISKGIYLFAAPTANVYFSDQTTGLTGYRFPIPPKGFPTYSFSDKITGWIGVSAGIALF